MLNVNAIILGLAVSVAQVNGHFNLNYPTTLGFDDKTEGTGPCGGFDPSLDKTTDFHIGGDVIAVKSTHPKSNWYFRATTNENASGGWVNILPEIEQTGLGSYCEQDLTLPDSFAGKKGFVQAVQHAVDGDLFQCAPVNFVAGKAASIPSDCKNATGISATRLGGAASSSAASSSAASTGSSAPSSTSGGGGASQTSDAPAETSTGAASAIGGSEAFGAFGAAAMSLAALLSPYELQESRKLTGNKARRNPAREPLQHNPHPPRRRAAPNHRPHPSADQARGRPTQARPLGSDGAGAEGAVAWRGGGGEGAARGDGQDEGVGWAGEGAVRERGEEEGEGY
ncbi:hypothetical protein V498_02715 [Pseudogymnoascus sp. VKM F-4517 (FW-2822)]|nr:hypothetical protein V498_02715 [Pseudogymnoascus sp. VKM F-4517 (FW-2822)]